ncbi:MULTISPECIES: prolyl oligopeptidase family serine peptidase [unclassified Imperialibacter]|uniref:S9 family peptidase n=1 Tax=unclassified Imperialibacter TaxID=2629706 RepID=UPI0012529916|nr:MULTISPECIES: prolyl oligopeptidase family serine peptidase [unclassified Imperialibacter]CAD5250674.1 S9 family peptidase [Imperialibacter sp. 75]CAD5286062.1 S9 family peptidase [Imperialibacter sp. 89]VVT05240.1 S9 family peptidase [Imperialibacter sp. EC-SDR9]
MKRLILPAMAFGLIFGCEQTPEKVAVKTYSIEQFYKNINVSGGSFSPDESKMLVSTNETGIYNAYEIPVDGKGEKKQLTNSTVDSYFAVSYFPNDERLIFTADQGGNENNHIYLQTPDGTQKDLTPYDSAKSSFYGWSQDKQSMFIASNKRDAKFMDVYERTIASLDSETGFGEVIYQNNDGRDVAAISPDKNYFALTESITSADSKMYLYNKATGETTDISEHEGDVQYNPQFFSLDNKELYYLTDEGAEFVYLVKRDLATGATEKVYEDKWDVWYAYESQSGKYRVIGVNEDASTKVHIFDMTTGKEVTLPAIEGGSIASVNISDGEKLARLTVSTSASPSNIYVYNFETNALTKLTDTLNPEMAASDLVEGKVVRFKSFDGTEIPGIYYQPKNAAPGEKVPALVWVHGGPGGQTRLSYFALIQYLVNHGYAILAVNNRGSSGYGKTFYHMDDQNHGDKDLKDCVAGKSYLASTGVIDMDKVGIIGGSYGGYMVMAALTFAPEEFNVGVNLFGVTNWLRTLKSIPPYWESFRKSLYDEMGDPYTADSVRLYEISPLFHTENVTKPLMVLQGANDVRVLPVESDEIVAGVKANGVPVEYVVFDDEGHGFRKKENEIKGYGQVLVFLDKYLKGEGEPVAEK